MLGWPAAMGYAARLAIAHPVEGLVVAGRVLLDDKAFRETVKPLVL